MAISELNLSSLLGNWPRDFIAQQQYLNKLFTLFSNFEDGVLTNINSVVTLSQLNEPTHDEWEAAWVSQTGKLPPVPPYARLFWYNTEHDTFGGEYGTVLGNSTVVRREHIFPKGATILIDQDYLNSAQTITTSLYSNNAVMPVLTFDLPCTCDLILFAGLNVKRTAGTGSWGLDFLVNGDKIGTTEYGVNPAFGIYNTDTDGYLAARALLVDKPAGSYTVQTMFGYVGTTVPTLSIGATGVNDGRHLIVRAIAK